MEALQPLLLYLNLPVRIQLLWLALLLWEEVDRLSVVVVEVDTTLDTRTSITSKTFHRHHLRLHH